MNRTLQVPTQFGILLLLAAVAAAGTLTHTVTFRPEDLTVTARDGGLDVQLQNAPALPRDAGLSLPLVSLNLLLPPTAEIRGVEVLAADSIQLPGGECPEFKARSLDEDDVLPGRIAEIVPAGNAGGFRVAGVIIHPVQYRPASRELTLYTRLVLSITYDEGVHPVRVLTASQAELFGRQVTELVANRADLKRFTPAVRALDAEVDYAIVTPAALAPAWAPLLDLRRGQGWNSIVMPVETIYARYPGDDNPARIRAFIADYRENRGLKWVVLGGDHGLVPTRFGYLPYSTNIVPADLYYADLDWSWDSNHNGRYGEMTEDTLDLFSDVFVGRIPCDNAAHIANWFGKDTTYERHPDPAALTKAYLPWEVLWGNIGYTGALVNANLRNALPPTWTCALESARTNLIRDSLNAGCHFLHFAGPGNINQFGATFYSQGVPSLNNAATGRLPIIASTAGYCGEFDDVDCLGESLVNYRNGGAVAALLNARQGWNAPPNLGPGEHFMLGFARSWGDGPELGRAAAIARDGLRNIALSQMVYRMTSYGMTLFGDPAMPLWTRAPETLAVNFPDSIPAGPQLVRVHASARGRVLGGATVTLLRHGQVAAAGRTNEAGLVALPVTTEPGDTIDLRVRARDCLPFAARIRSGDSETLPRLELGEPVVADSGNRRLDPGETADVFIPLRNTGNAPAFGVRAELRAFSPQVVLLDSFAGYGSLLSGDTVPGDRYRVAVGESCQAGTELGFLLQVEDSAQHVTLLPLDLPVGFPPHAGTGWATHDTGNFFLSVTGLGSIGSTGRRAEGVGLIYPKDFPQAASRLVLASLVIGSDTDYVCDRFYHPDFPANDSDFRLLDSVRPVVPPERADEEFRAVFDDGGHRNPKRLEITQHSMVLSRQPLDNACVLEYTIANRDSVLTPPLAVGLLADFKLTGWNVNDSFDQAAAESLTRLAYVYTGDTAALGVRLLYPPAVQGLSVIDGFRYLQAPGMMSDAVKDSFLWGRKQVANGSAARNWAVLVSTGPFLLPPGGDQRVAFAIVGGRSRAGLRANADSIQQWYDRNSGLAGPGPAAPLLPFTVTPQLFRQSLEIHYAAPPDRQLTIDAYDAAGRRVARIFSGPVSAPGCVTWTPDNAARGIFFIRAGTRTAKVVRLE